jgi:hypothetical protein
LNKREKLSTPTSDFVAPSFFSHLVRWLTDFLRHVESGLCLLFGNLRFSTTNAPHHNKVDGFESTRINQEFCVFCSKHSTQRDKAAMLSQCTSLAHLWLGYAIIGDDLAWRGGWQRCARSAFHSHTRTLATTASELRGRGGFGLQLCHPLI